jgi:hypothetical protein
MHRLAWILILVAVAAPAIGRPTPPDRGSVAASRRQTPVDIAARLHSKIVLRCMPEPNPLHTPFEHEIGLRFRFPADVGRPPAVTIWGAPEPAQRRCVTDEADRLIRTGELARGGEGPVIVDYPVWLAPLHKENARAVRSTFRILATGFFPKDDLAPAEASGDWLALCKRGDAVMLVPTKVRISRADIEGERGWRVSATGCKGDDVVVLKGFADLPTGASPRRRSPPLGPPPVLDSVPLGPVRERFLPEGEDGAELAFDFHGKRYRLWHRRSERENLLVLEQGTESQLLFRGGVENGYELIWAGDLDGDAKLDLLLRTDCRDVTLFLSRDSGPPIMREAYSIITQGCS